jgi:hypothetical protein
MNSLHVCLFGCFQITHRGMCTAGTKISLSARKMLVYLLHQHGLNPRETLGGLFWGDHSKKWTRSFLSKALQRPCICCLSDEEQRVWSGFPIAATALF